MANRDQQKSSDHKPRVIVICGPTGSGKTGIAIEMATLFQGEIVSADSMQVYRHMNIGTAKPTLKEQSRVRHHMIDILDPTDAFDAARYVELAREIIAELHGSGIVPFVVGGTGFYIRALLHSLFQSQPPDPVIRKQLKKEAGAVGLSALYHRLAVVDPDAAAKIHPHDEFRIIRALEVLEGTGKKISDFHQTHQFFDKPYSALTIGLKMSREKLYQRINRRADAMIQNGLLREVKGLLSKGYDPNLKAMQSIGYRHMVHFIQGHMSWDETVRILKRDTRRYAKRQLTWFNNDSSVIWESPDNAASLQREIASFLKRL